MCTAYTATNQYTLKTLKALQHLVKATHNNIMSVHARNQFHCTNDYTQTL